MLKYVDAKTSPKINDGNIKIFDEKAFAKLKKAGQLTATALDKVTDMVKPGITTQEIDDFVYDFGKQHNALPATLNYKGYMKSCCTSINHVICHGIPNNKPLKEGDIVNIDITYILDGWHGDSSRMYCVGKVKRAASRLIDVTYESLMRGLDVIKDGAHLGDIGAAIQEYAENERCSVVRDFCGHGIGELFHDVPNVMHFGQKGQGIKLKKGMVFTVEPMINLGRAEGKILSDGWTAVTRDRSLSAQFEHMIGVTEKGCDIFTKSPHGYTKPPYNLEG